MPGLYSMYSVCSGRYVLFKKVMRTLDHIIERISYYGVYASGLMAVIMAVLVTYGVFRRYVLNNPEPYSYEISTMLLLFGIVFALSLIHI